MSLSLSLFVCKRLEGLQEVIKVPSCLYIENSCQYFSIFCMLTDKHKYMTKLTETNLQLLLLNPRQQQPDITAAARHHSPYSDDAVNQEFDSQQVQEILLAAERPDCLGAHPASNPMGNAFLSPHWKDRGVKLKTDFNVHGSVHRNNILAYNSNKMRKSQSLFNLTTALQVSGVTITHLLEHKTTVTTASGICHTVAAICCYRGRVGTGVSVLWVAYATHSTLTPVPALPR